MTKRIKFPWNIVENKYKYSKYKMVWIKDIIKQKKHLTWFLLTINIQQTNYPIEKLKDVMNEIYENIELFLKKSE
jgi:hypothetical protein